MEDTQTITIEQFIQKHVIDFTRKRIYDRPDGLMSDAGMRHWQFRIKHAGRGFNLYFSQGSGHTQDPTLADVLDCLASDASGFDGRTFEEWVDGYGYDADSRKAEKIFKAIKRQAEQLKRTIGTKAYEELLYNVERL